MYVFGPGVLIGTLAGGTPVNIGYAQEITYSEKASNKELFGSNRRPLAIGGGTIKSTVKVKMARISSLAIAQLWLGISPTAGGTFMQFAEAHTLPGGTPTMTIAPPNSGTFFQDQGVNYTTTGLPFTFGTVAPTLGTYSLNTATGVYSFAAADAAAAIQASYTFKTGSLGQSLLSGNPVLGNTVSVSCVIQITDPTNNLTALFQIFNCVFEGFDWATKLEDFMYPEMNGSCFVNTAGQVWQWNSPDKF